MSSSFTDLNDSQNESENNFVASYMMEVEDDTVYGGVTTEVSGPEGESEDDEWVVKPYEDEPLADELIGLLIITKRGALKYRN